MDLRLGLKKDQNGKFRIWAPEYLGRTFRCKTYPKVSSWGQKFHIQISKSENHRTIRRFRFILQILTLDYTCRARWPEELLCWLSQFLKSNIVQILKTHIVQIWKSEHHEHGFVISHLVSVSQNNKITLFIQNITDGQTDTQTDRHDSHIFILDPVCISRTQ